MLTIVFISRQQVIAGQSSMVGKYSKEWSQKKKTQFETGTDFY